MIQVVSLILGPLQSNCYLLIHSDSKKAIIVDPGDESEKIIQTIEDYEAEPILIINTHGHGDHIGGNEGIKKKYNIPLAIHHEDEHMLTDPNANLSTLVGFKILSPPADIILEDGDIQDLDGTSIKVLFTPGHSPGGISLYFENKVITGDALFRMSVGRTDIPGTSHEKLMKGIKEKLLSLPDETIVYPGHGPSTTIGFERSNNPFLGSLGG